MTRGEHHAAKFAALWRDNHKAFEQSNWFGSYYYQNNVKVTQRRLLAYNAKHGPFDITLIDGTVIHTEGWTSCPIHNAPTASPIARR